MPDTDSSLSTVLRNFQSETTRKQSDNMGKTEIRTVCKVDFDKPASEQPQLHVSDSLSFYPDLVRQVKIQKLTKQFYPLPGLTEQMASRHPVRQLHQGRRNRED